MEKRKGIGTKGQSTEAHEREGNRDHREGQIEARMAMEYQKRKDTGRLTNNPSLSLHGWRTEARAKWFVQVFNSLAANRDSV